LIGVFGEVLAGAREATASPEIGETPPTATSLAEADPDAEVAERAGRLLLKTLKFAGGLEELSAAHEAVSAYRGNNYLPLLDGFYRSHWGHGMKKGPALGESAGPLGALEVRSGSVRLGR
jgi:hypothetical protein